MINVFVLMPDGQLLFSLRRKVIKRIKPKSSFPALANARPGYFGWPALVSRFHRDYGNALFGVCGLLKLPPHRGEIFVARGEAPGYELKRSTPAVVDVE
jgi:hypothetical protein